MEISLRPYSFLVSAGYSFLFILIVPYRYNFFWKRRTPECTVNTSGSPPFLHYIGISSFFQLILKLFLKSRLIQMARDSVYHNW